LNASLAIVEFSAGWCNQCAKFSPIYSKLSDQFPLVQFLVVDVEELKGEIEEVSLVIKIPSFYVYKKGKVEAIVEGPYEDQIINILTQQISQSKNYSDSNAQLTPVTDLISISPQPSTQQLKNLDLIGIKCLINLRCIDEEGFNHAEENIVTSKGIKYALIPIKEASDMDINYVDQVNKKDRRINKNRTLSCSL